LAPLNKVVGVVVVLLLPLLGFDIVLNDQHPKFKEVGEWNGIGTIFYLTTENPTTQDVSEQKANCALSNLKQYPLINEIVYLFSLTRPIITKFR
jgi:hypothetical protein